MLKFDVLQAITKKLAKDKITWGIGGSLLLYFHGITNTFQDIDILVAELDVHRADKALTKLMKKEEGQTKEPFCTRHFYKYKTAIISIDLMSGFGIEHSKGTYWLDFKESSVVGRTNENTPLSSLEDWYVLYQLIPGREEKVKLLEEYWSNHPIQHKNILEAALGNSLPENVSMKILQLIESQLN